MVFVNDVVWPGPDALQTGSFTGAMGEHAWTADARAGFEQSEFALFDPLQSCSEGTCVAPAS